MAVAISAITIIVLCLNNEWIKPKWSRISILPIPIELIAVVSGTLASQFFDLASAYGVETIGHIPTGFPAFEMPNMDLSKQLLVDGFIISMVSYTVSVSMALIFAQKLSYEIDFNQELLALGASNVFGSFFSCLPLSASLSRSAIQVRMVYRFIYFLNKMKKKNIFIILSFSNRRAGEHKLHR